MPAPSRTATDYSKFSHNTKKHQAACNTCHKVPTSNWQKTSTYPDITDYPGHDACVSCHRSQFFKGASPPICSGCHKKTSPRDEARLVFRNPAKPTQFTTEFPHVGSIEFYREISNRLSSCDLILAEGVKSKRVHMLTLSYRIVKYIRRMDLVTQQDGMRIESFRTKILNADMTTSGEVA